MFDYIFITHLPSFYKINLYNELSKTLKVCVIFVGRGSDIRTNDFISDEINFDYYFLSDQNFEKRSSIKSLIKLFFILEKIKSKKIVIGGWDLPEFWLAVFLNRKNKNTLALESSVEESYTNGSKGIVKKFFLNRITTVFASGLSQKRLLDKLNFKKEVFITKGVGIINKPAKPKKDSSFNNNFLYVGRLSEEKNLIILIQAFNELQQFKLKIIGSGPLKSKLKEIAGQNISFIDHVENNNIGEIYLENSVLILPSIREPWGLVVEEALYFGLPVIVSNKVGSSLELVKDGENGIIFNALSREDLKNSIIKMAQNYSSYYTKVQEYNQDEKDKEQINCYINAIS